MQLTLPDAELVAYVSYGLAEQCCSKAGVQVSDISDVSMGGMAPTEAGMPCWCCTPSSREIAGTPAVARCPLQLLLVVPL